MFIINPKKNKIQKIKSSYKFDDIYTHTHKREYITTMDHCQNKFIKWSSHQVGDSCCLCFLRISSSSSWLSCRNLLRKNDYQYWICIAQRIVSWNLNMNMKLVKQKIMSVEERWLFAAQNSSKALHHWDVAPQHPLQSQSASRQKGRHLGTN